jgi:hypothetical protein
MVITEAKLPHVGWLWDAGRLRVALTLVPQRGNFPVLQQPTHGLRRAPPTACVIPERKADKHVNVLADFNLVKWHCQANKRVGAHP